MVASYIWAPLWAQKRIVFYCDNQAVVSIINSKRSKSPRITDLVRALNLQTLKYNFYFKAFHVPGHYNDIADSISRFQQTRFRWLAPHADPNLRTFSSLDADVRRYQLASLAQGTIIYKRYDYI